MTLKVILMDIKKYWIVINRVFVRFSSNISNHKGTSLYACSCFGRVNWVEIAGIKYRESLAVLVEFQKELPVFGRIEAVLKVDGDFRLFVTLYEVSYFDHHLHAYKVKLTSLKHLCSVVNLRDHTTLSIYQSFGSTNTCIVLKYHVEDSDE